MEEPGLDKRAGRLREAIERWGSVRAFATAMEERGVKGATRSMIHRYLRAQPEPPVPFLKEAADLLGVRDGWLVDGQKPRTDAELRASNVATPSMDHVHAALAATFPVYRFGSSTLREAVWQSFRRIHVHVIAEHPEYLEAVGALHGSHTPEILAQAKSLDTVAARQTGRAFMAALLALQCDVGALTMAQVEDYSRATSLALAALFPEPVRFSVPINAVAQPEDLIPEELHGER